MNKKTKMKTIMLILIPSTLSFLLGRHLRYRSKNYGVTRKMFLTLEKGEIDRKIEVALDLKDYESALLLKRKMDRLERKLIRLKRKEKKSNEKNVEFFTQI